MPVHDGKIAARVVRTSAEPFHLGNPFVSGALIGER
jgi:hypothetical protein